MTAIKANEAYFGDVFNRDACVTACNAGTITFSCDKAIMVPEDLCSTASASASTWNMEIPISAHAVSATQCYQSTINTVLDRVNDIEARIGALESTAAPKKDSSTLRSALRTLNYTREL